MQNSGAPSGVFGAASWVGRVNDDTDVAGPGGFTGITQDYTYPRLFNLYGSSETGFGAIATPADLRAAPGTVGYPPAGATVRVLGPDDRPGADHRVRDLGGDPGDRLQRRRGAQRHLDHREPALDEGAGERDGGLRVVQHDDGDDGREVEQVFGDHAGSMSGRLCASRTAAPTRAGPGWTMRAVGMARM